MRSYKWFVINGLRRQPAWDRFPWITKNLVEFRGILRLLVQPH